MLKSLLLGVSIVALAGIATASAQQPPAGIKRTPLQKIEFPDGYHTVTGIAEIAPGLPDLAADPRDVVTGTLLKTLGGAAFD